MELVVNNEQPVVIALKEKVSLDMRSIMLSSYHSGFLVPWSAATSVDISELGILTVYAEWKSDNDEIEQGSFTNAIAVVPCSGVFTISESMSLNKKIGKVSFEGRDYLIFLADEFTDYSYALILSPVWRDGGLVFESTARLPDYYDHFIAASATPIKEDHEDITSTLFAVYLTYASSEAKDHSVISVTPAGDDIVVNIDNLGEKIPPFTIQQLRDCVENYSSRDIEEM